MLRSALLLAALAGPAHANEFCDELWFTRNLIFDRAGYCFGSTLGMELFDNSDCLGKNVSLPAGEQAKVRQIQDLEARVGCRVDTSRGFLDVPGLQTKRRLRDIPVPDELASGCIGWQGLSTALHAGHDASTQVIGWIQAGDSVLFDHYPIGDWVYVTVFEKSDGGGWGPFKSGGWVTGNMGQSACEMWAG